MITHIYDSRNLMILKSAKGPYDFRDLAIFPRMEKVKQLKNCCSLAPK